ncbi:MAG: hypothetical protein MI794_06825 [Pseudomonadales bacterium]|nr:hypothetical protein [Pseudomonadales bacterium]
MNPPDFAETKIGIGTMLDTLREKVESTLEKRFIYFFASRPKVRFDTTRPPRYEFFSKKLVLHLRIGRERRRVTLKRRFCDAHGNVILPKVELSERFIRIVYSEGSSQMYSVHDFLQVVGFAIGEPTTVHYVGITKDPGDRPLSRKHRGIADTLYNVSNEENDFFVYINLFKVTAHANSSMHNMVFVAANAYTDEIKTDAEGAIVEGALIAYFECASQRLNRSKERSAFRRLLDEIAEANKIRSVVMHIEIEQPSEYFSFGSTVVPAANSHTFVFKNEGGKSQLTKLSGESELLSLLQTRDA